jgi:hypothetical protein
VPSTPVITGPRLCAHVLTTLIVPMTAVRSLGSTIAAKKAERGATSMTCVQARPMRKVRAPGRVEGMGIRERQIAEGRWVKTIVCKAGLVSVDRCLRVGRGSYLDVSDSL